MEIDEQLVQKRTQCWVETLVVGEQLCPFAHQPMQTGRIRYHVSHAQDSKTLLIDLTQELQRLTHTPGEILETTLLIHPLVLQDFFAYNEFLDQVDECLVVLGYEGELQVASFHPNYQFANTAMDAIENYTNRSPYPMLHLLREHSIEQALRYYLNSDAIPERNIAHLKQLGLAKLKALLVFCAG